MPAFIAIIALLAPAVAATAEVVHPVYAAEFEFTAERLKGAVDASAPIMAMSDEAVHALITDKAGFNEIQCPNCTSGKQGDQLTWTIDAPNQVTCRYCGHVYPSEQYPMDRVYEHVAPTGETQQYPCYEG
ncbi:MAG TPA: hypothetical protein DEP45_08045, partial [Armatimonadetes bacterium]|nr:hypothetical protein [Armatimonadota bacterium]